MSLLVALGIAPLFTCQSVQPEGIAKGQGELFAVASTSQARAEEIKKQYLELGGTERLASIGLKFRIVEDDRQFKLIVDEDVFQQSVAGPMARFLVSISSKKAGSVLELNAIGPGAKDDLSSVMYRLPFSPEFLTAYLGHPESKVGIAALSKIAITKGDRTVQLTLRAGHDHDFQRQLGENAASFEEIETTARERLNVEKTKREIALREPDRIVFCFLHPFSSLADDVAGLAKASAILSKAMQLEMDNLKRRRAALAAKWLEDQFGTEVWPRSALSFDELGEGHRKGLESALTARFADLGFASRSEALQFLQGGRVTFGTPELALNIANFDRNGTLRGSSVSLAGIRF